GRIDEKAHVYYDILASHPRKDDATSAHVEAMMLAWYAGHMAGRGWMAPVVAQQAAFGLGRRLRDRLKGLGVDVYDRGAAFSLVIDQVLLEIVEQGLKETAATRSP
ncbi:MAG: hypothetical protein HY815_31605, partial [Candidatus Riflebacteria bacterium]|nr:hypothetical protein [Candidatus Riflebacteria bacterium]